jgi:hypothetical protein
LGQHRKVHVRCLVSANHLRAWLRGGLGRCTRGCFAFTFFVSRCGQVGCAVDLACRFVHQCAAHSPPACCCSLLDGLAVVVKDSQLTSVTSNWIYQSRKATVPPSLATARRQQVQHHVVIQLLSPLHLCGPLPCGHWLGLAELAQQRRRAQPQLLQPIAE